MPESVRWNIMEPGKSKISEKNLNAISSRVSPLVSGVKNMVNTNASAIKPCSSYNNPENKNARVSEMEHNGTGEIKNF